MKTNTDLPMAGAGSIKTKKGSVSGIGYYLAKFRGRLSKYVTVDKDAIFKDPDWPHLWDHKR